MARKEELDEIVKKRIEKLKQNEPPEPPEPEPKPCEGVDKGEDVERAKKSKRKRLRGYVSKTGRKRGK